MSGKQHVFSDFDSWVIDIVAAFGIALLIAGAVMAFISSLLPPPGGPERGGAFVALFLFVFVLTLVRHRKLRAERVAEAVEGGESAGPGGRTRRPARG